MTHRLNIRRVVVDGCYVWCAKCTCRAHLDYPTWGAALADVWVHLLDAEFIRLVETWDLPPDNGWCFRCHRPLDVRRESVGVTVRATFYCPTCERRKEAL